MKSFSASLVTAALLVAGVAAQDFQINTPNPPTQCVPSRFTWSGGQEPYFLAIAPGGVPGATAFQQYTGVTGTSFTWSTNISAGTSIGLTLTDNNGAVAQSAPVTIQAGPDSSCLNGAASQSSGGSTPTTTAGGSSGTTAATGPATSPAGTTTGTTGGSSGTSGSTKSSGSSASGSGTTSTTPTGGASGNNGAFSNVASMGVVGFLGAAAALVLA